MLTGATKEELSRLTFANAVVLCKALSSCPDDTEDVMFATTLLKRVDPDSSVFASVVTEAEKATSTSLPRIWRERTLEARYMVRIRAMPGYC